ncbi:hypothetical protein VTJ49DRAFT_3647 [Mycothermus thermophilus]|uniref:Uncharacterized protein n=1 Tax=Humicola insolens TaxID=85995 RepID=A0ABR3V7Z6_HUMIN
MRTLSIVSSVLAAAAVARAGVRYEDGQFICESEDPNAAFCAGDSLGTDIIIRCNGTQGQPGRCSNNLSGQPPIGAIYPARCWQSSDEAGDAACEKNCVVYGDSGNYPDTFTLPEDVCTPYYTAPSSSTESLSTASVPSSGVESTTETQTETTTTTTVFETTTTEEDCEETVTLTTTSTVVTSTTDDCCQMETTTTSTTTSSGGSSFVTATPTPTETTSESATSSSTSTVVTGGAAGNRAAAAKAAAVVGLGGLVVLVV